MLARPFGYEDVSNLTGATGSNVDIWAPQGPVPLNFSLPSLPFESGDDGACVPQLLSSLDDGNGHSQLYDLLRCMALSENSAPALAVRYAITSLAMLHTKGLSKADLYRAKAISALRQSISRKLERKEALQAMAASMLMEIYEVISFAHPYCDYRDGHYCLLMQH